MSILVTGANGGIGGAVARQLLARNQGVTALVRDRTKSSAQQLETLGARVVVGDFNDIVSLKEAAKGCVGLFLNTSPGRDDEATQARNVLSAAKQSGIEIVVCSTAVRAGEHESFSVWTPDCPFTPYWKGKEAIQEAVKTSGFRHWCILQPCWLMTNWIVPVSRFYWPELASEHVLLTAATPEAKFDLTDPQDVGKFATQALMEPEKWHGKIVKVASDARTLGEIAGIMTELSGIKVAPQFRSEAEVQELLNTNVFVWTQNWLVKDGLQVDYDEVRGYGVQLTSTRDFMARNESALREALTPA